MDYRIEIYENILDEYPIAYKQVTGVLEAEAAVRTLTELANDIKNNELTLKDVQLGKDNEIVNHK